MTASLEEWKETFEKAADSTKIEVSIMMAIFNTDGLDRLARKDVFIAAFDAHRHACVIEALTAIMEKDEKTPWPLEMLIATYGIREMDRLKERMAKFATVFDNILKEKKKAETNGSQALQ